MPARIAVVVFPGSNCEQDVVRALKILGASPDYVWHHSTDLGAFDAVILPGGFAFGDYLRTGAIAAFSPVLGAIRKFAADGGPVLGICNGFQILCEAGLLPGALRRNSGLKFLCRPVWVRVETTTSPFTASAETGRVLQIPINHFEGNYYCPGETLAALDAEERILFRYCSAEGAITASANPNGALSNIAGVIGERRNVAGMMPHPERAVDPGLGPVDGNLVLGSLLASLSSAAGSLG